MTRFIGLSAFAVALVGLISPSLATVALYSAALSGANEASPNASPGTGLALVDYDDVAHTLRVQVTFSDLLGTTTAAHIHSPTDQPGSGVANVATQVPSFSGFPLGVTSGAYDNTFDLTQATSWNPSFITNNGGSPETAEAALAAGLAAGKAYLNIHTSLFGGGEIRGFLEPVPEPATLTLLALGALSFVRRRS